MFQVKKGTRFVQIGGDNKLVDNGIVLNVTKFDDVKAGIHNVDEDHIPVYVDSEGRTFAFTHTIDKKAIKDDTTTEAPEQIPILRCLSAKDIKNWESAMFIEDVHVIKGCFFRTDNISNCLLDVTRTFTDKQGAVSILGDLLSGVYRVNVNSGEVEEDGYGGKHYSMELYNVLKALGVKTVPLEIISFTDSLRGDGDTEGHEELQIKQLYNMTKEQACGLIAGLLDGTTQIDGETEVIYCCYGNYPQSYATVQEVLDYTTREEFLKELDSTWGQLTWEHALEAEKEHLKLVNKFVDLLLS